MSSVQIHEPVDGLDLAAVTRMSPLLSAEFLEHAGVLPVAKADQLDVLTWHDAIDVQVQDDLQLLFGVPLRITRGPENELRTAILRI